MTDARCDFGNAPFRGVDDCQGAPAGRAVPWARGEPLLPSPPNVDGSWEHAEFVELNEQILNKLGGGWDFPHR